MTNRPRPRVGYRPDGHYGIMCAIDITKEQEQEAHDAGIDTAKTNPIPVTEHKASTYEKRLHKDWGKTLVEITEDNINRSRNWGELIKAELQELKLEKDELRNRLKNRRNMLSDSRLGLMSYIIILTLVAIVELPINVKIFDMFGENVIFTFLLAGTLTIFLTLISHFIGGWIKSEGLKIRSIGLIFLVIVLLGIAAWARLRFFTTEGVVSEYFKTNIELSIIAGFFFIINTLLLIVSLIASANHHDSDQLFVLAKKRYDAQYKKLSNLLRAREEEMTNLYASISRCQECFKNLRHIYIDAYKSTGAPEPLCFKESINLDTSRISHLETLIEEIKQDFKEQKNDVSEALKPIEVSRE